MKDVLIRAFIQRIEEKIHASKTAYHNTQNPKLDTTYWQQRELSYARDVENDLHMIDRGIKVDWSGLYPTTVYKGKSYYSFSELLNTVWDENNKK